MQVNPFDKFPPTPIREQILGRLFPRLMKHCGELTVVEFDVQMLCAHVEGALRSGWAIVVVIPGPRRNQRLAHTHVIDQPNSPSDEELEKAVIKTFAELRELRSEAESLDCLDFDPPHLDGEGS